jgi:hypothetical protein
MKECIALRDILKKGNSRTGKVEQGNIYGILKDSMKAYNNWIKNLKNKGKEFRFEIDKDVDPDKAMPILDRIIKNIPTIEIDL